MPEHEFAAPSEPPGSVRMTNDDFRKLMMTPRASASSAGKETAATVVSPNNEEKKSSASDSRKKKKAYYAKLKREEDDTMAQLAAKYRDRAKERRETDHNERDDNEERKRSLANNDSGYHAVADPNSSSGTKQMDPGERRKRLIQESKYLGGDMEHTHLVKGLDFALLQKVRSEISYRERHGDEHEDDHLNEEDNVDEEENDEKRRIKAVKKSLPLTKNTKAELAPKVSKSKEQPSSSSGGAKDPFNELMDECRTGMAKSVLRTVFKSDIPRTNELFYPGRMAYIMELQEGESDIPTTSIRSKADMENADQGVRRATISNNDIVINKLTQILAYLRTGNRGKNKKKRDRAMQPQQKTTTAAVNIKQEPKDDIDIYDDVGDYRATGGSESRRDRKEYKQESSKSRKGRERERTEKRSYFDGESSGIQDPTEHKGGLSSNDKDFIRKLATKEREREMRQAPHVDPHGGVALSAVDGYAECYPGLEEMNDAIEDSDEETDFTKMDGSNKKGPVNRWDFESAEEYSAFMSSKEAMPKAAFQYGVKMNAGRKTRGKVGPRGEKAKLDKEWTKISAILEKRKGDGKGDGEAKKKRNE